MNKKGNFVENWDESYASLKTTYSEDSDTPGNLVNKVQFEFVHEDLQKYLLNKNNAKILEVGCGGARTSLYLAKRGFDVTCSDTSVEALRLAEKNFALHNAKGTFLADDLLNSKIPAESFDCVMSFGLLEHFEDLSPLLTSITRLVKPGGIQIHCVITKKFSTQTIMDILFYPLNFLRRLFKGDLKQIFSRSFRDFPHYENSFTAREYCQAFKLSGNSILRCEAGGFLFPFFNLPFGLGSKLVHKIPNILEKLVRFTDRTQSRLFHKIAPTFYVVCRKNESVL